MDAKSVPDPATPCSPSTGDLSPSVFSNGSNEYYSNGATNQRKWYRQTSHRQVWPLFHSSQAGLTSVWRGGGFRVGMFCFACRSIWGHACCMLPASLQQVWISGQRLSQVKGLDCIVIRILPTSGFVSLDCLELWTLNCTDINRLWHYTMCKTVGTVTRLQRNIFSIGNNSDRVKCQKKA